MLFLTHTLHEHAVARYRRLEREAPADHDVLLAFDATTADPETRAAAERVAGDALHRFRFPLLETTGYPRPWAGDNDERLVPGNIGLLLLDLHRAHERWDRYWLIEYDVAFTGDWSTFLEHFRDSDGALLGTTLQPRSVLPGFHWWDALRTPGAVDPPGPLRGFFPVMRVSRKGLRALDHAYSEGWSGHLEVVLPTALRHYGLEIEDVGGEGPFVRPGNENRFYTNTPWRTGLGPGTFIYRPPRRWPGLRRDKLWHPVKPTQGRLSQYLDLARDWWEARVREDRS